MIKICKALVYMKQPSLDSGAWILGTRWPDEKGKVPDVHASCSTIWKHWRNWWAWWSCAGVHFTRRNNCYVGFPHHLQHVLSSAGYVVPRQISRCIQGYCVWSLELIFQGATLKLSLNRRKLANWMPSCAWETKVVPWCLSNHSCSSFINWTRLCLKVSKGKPLCLRV